MHNKAGTEAGSVVTSGVVQSVSAGTLTNNGFTVTSNAANTMDIEADFTSSLTQTTLKINWRGHYNSDTALAATAITAQ